MQSYYIDLKMYTNVDLNVDPIQGRLVDIDFLESVLLDRKTFGEFYLASLLIKNQPHE
jgi:hypothetical protein